MEVTLCAGSVFAERIHPAARLTHSGDIVGIVECPEGSLASGVLVHIVGHSFMAKTDSNGAFRLYNVPKGTYELAIELAQNRMVILENVEVRRRSITDLGAIVACQEDSCDDGTSPICLIIPPQCGEGSILAIQNRCWQCVNPVTCLPW